MSLNFDLTAIPLEIRTIVADADDEQQDIAKGDRIMNPITNALIWASLGIGIGKFTRENIAEVMFRLKVTDGIYGPALVETVDGVTKRRGFTLEEVYDHIGLKTNVSEEKRTSWIARLGKHQVRDFEYSVRGLEQKRADTAAA